MRQAQLQDEEEPPGQDCKLGTLGCKVALNHLLCKGAVSKINGASLTHALQAKQQLAMQQQLQDRPDALLQLMQLL